MSDKDKKILVAQTPDIGKRLDKFLAVAFPDMSRARIQSLIKAGQVTMDGRCVKPGALLPAGAIIEVSIPDPAPADLKAEDIPLAVVYEDADIAIINKPAGMVVHPAPGHHSGTLVNALLHRYEELGGTAIGGELRPGIVHRLDRDTSGLLVVARNDAAMAGLVAQFKAKTIEKEYVVLVWGRPVRRSGIIRTGYGRSAGDRKKMAVQRDGEKQAVTRYEIERGLGRVSIIRARIETGRTHQIRVHMAHIGCPVLGDRTYGGGRTPDNLRAGINRQMLHAAKLAFAHPCSGKRMEFAAPLPDDMEVAIARLEKEQQSVPAQYPRRATGRAQIRVS